MNKLLIEYIFVFIFGICIGSFINVVIYRLPRNLSLVKRNSFCPRCNNSIKWIDKIPIISYLFLRGKCRYCKSKISTSYIIIELVTGLISIIFYSIYSSWIFIICLAISYIFLVIFMIDKKYFLIPNILNLLLLIIGICVIVFHNKIKWNSICSIKEQLLGLLIGIVLLILYLLLDRITKKEYIGGGDVKLIFVCNLILGYKLAFIGLFTASFISLVIESIKKNKEAFPFGPYLVIGYALCLMIGCEL